jgi:glucosamine--fructose-6-phosphate aminotransferase (isomerizing)
MCGIVGYLGKKQAAPLLLEGLRRLEYRGYDSAGISVVDDKNKITTLKAAGKIDVLVNLLEKKKPKGRWGIGHSRWATHGAVTEKNAHPHWDCQKNIFLVHNGIIENYRQLKEKLIKEGHKFRSETDTEVLAHLIEKFFKSNLEEGVIRALKLVKGAYGLAIISKNDSQKIVVARNSSPILIGIGDNEYIAASDASAILTHTKKVVHLNDGEIAIITPKGINFTNLARENLLKKAEILEWSADWQMEKVQKAGYPHFMLKEIFEQPEALRNSIAGRLIEKEGLAKLGGLESIADKLREIERLIIVACGTAYLAGLVGEYMLEEYAGVPTEVEFGSEFRYRKPILDKKTALLCISQSGETADTLAALREAKRKGILTLGIVNVVGSTISRETEAGVYNHIGPEIGVASTKAFTSQLVILALLTLFLGRQRQMSLVMGQRIAKEIKHLPDLVEKILKQAPLVKKLAKKYYQSKNFLFLGRKYNYPIALEGALKLKEISYIHAEGYGAGEMKHGPIALIDKNFPTFGIVASDSVYEKMISNLEEIKARQGPILAIATEPRNSTKLSLRGEGNKEIKKITNDIIYIPKTLEMLTPILSVVPCQLFAYYCAVLLGKDVDRPRNLAKSCTVE